jgi:hypothetical protein
MIRDERRPSLQELIDKRTGAEQAEARRARKERRWAMLATAYVMACLAGWAVLGVVAVLLIRNG